MSFLVLTHLRFRLILVAEIRDSCITADGSLTHPFHYIENLRAQKLRASSKKSITKSNQHSHLVWIEGHLFDSALINQILDSLETSELVYEIRDINVPPYLGSSPLKSTLILSLSSANKELLDNVTSKLQDLCRLISKADATMKILPSSSSPSSFVKEKINEGAPADFQRLPNVLLLGSGMVAGPFVRYLDANKIPMSIATDCKTSGEQLASRCPNRSVTEVTHLDAKNAHDLDLLISRSPAKAIVSFLPPAFHVEVAKLCLKYSKHLVTASYVSPEMNALSDQAQEKGLTFINEVGLDPGIDHMSAMQVINHEKSMGRKITVFESFCGGLPAPEAAANPFRYKFSWSPKGVFSAMQAPAVYRKNGEVVKVSGQELMSNSKAFRRIPVLGLEHIPNRNSLPYSSLYGIDGHNLQKMYRGTLRYQGFCSLMQACKGLGLMTNSPIDENRTWESIISENLGCFSSSELRRELSIQYPSSGIEEALEWLGMIGTDLKPLSGKISTLDAFAALLEERLKYQEGERDMVVLVHRFQSQDPNNPSDVRTITSSLVSYGDGYGQGDSAMAKTVGYTTAISSKLLLDGAVRNTGVVIPVSKDFYDPVLYELGQLGIHVRETME